MGEVATGGSGSGSKGGDTIEALPLLLKVPQIGRLASACSGPSLLGFGDIIVPGLLTGFAHTFDVLSGNKYRPYFISTFIGKRRCTPNFISMLSVLANNIDALYFKVIFWD